MMIPMMTMMSHVSGCPAQPPSSSRCLAICYPLGDHWPDDYDGDDDDDDGGDEYDDDVGSGDDDDDDGVVLFCHL